MRILEVSHIGRTGRDGFSLQDTCFSLEKGQQIAIAGETGSGKTTLLKIISGLEQPDTGKVLFEGRKVVGPLEKLIPGHPDIAYLSQHFELRNNYRVEEILSYANKFDDFTASNMFRLCRIDHLLKRKTDQLSGGEKQRIALARLLIGSPKLLVLDEPFSNLDPVHKQMLKSVLQEISRDLGTSFILSSHDPADTLSWAHQIIVLQNGRVVQHADPQIIYHQPANEYTGALFGTYSLVGTGLAASYPTFFPIHPSGKNIFTRPEYFQMVEDSNGIRGTVKAVHFMGAYYEVELAVSDQLLLVRSYEGPVLPGTELFVNKVFKEVWYV